MTQLSLSNDLIEITAEINIWKQTAGQSVFEIGRRLKHVKEKNLTHGQWLKWLESVDINPRTAQRMIQVYEQFGNTTAPSHLPMGKMFELLSLPDSVDREDFISKPHIVHSTGETKVIDEMTDKQLREVTKQYKEAERQAKDASERAARAEQDARHWQGVAKSAQNQPARIETKTVEVIPPHIKKKMEEDEFALQNLRIGYQETKEKLKAYELQNTVDFDEKQAEMQRKKLQHEADMEALQISIHFKQFIEKAAMSSYQQAALAASSDMEKRRLFERIEVAERIIRETKLALMGRKVSAVNE